MDDDSVSGITKYQNGLGIDNKLELTNGTDTKYFLQDHLGSTVGLADSSGNQISSASYDSFGNSTNNLTTRYQYTGREKDEFTGLMYYRARWYDANLGRFISEDPIGFAGGDVNLYGYVWNNSQNYTDPSGFIPLKLPANPGTNGSNLPKGWKNDTSHKYPKGQRWVSPNGDEGLDFHEGTPGETGFEGKDHWHKLKPGKNGKLEKDKSGGRKGGHYLPDDGVELDNCFSLNPKFNIPTLFELQLREQAARHMEEFWWDVTKGGVVIGAVLTGGAFGGFAGTGGAAAEAGGWGWLPALGF
jgi:RHS repeat-associated protein